MLNNQPSQAAAAAMTNAGRDNATGSRPTPPHYLRFTAEVVLIRNWLRIIRQCSMVAGHGTICGRLPSHEELLLLLEAAEEAIASRVESGAALLDRLTGWEASLLHWEPDTDPDDCLIRRRAKGIPVDLPSDYAWALLVLEEAA